jgi:glucose-6-phosphate 1-epimerase
MELVMTNSGDVPLRYEAALHTYFRIGDVNKVRVRGLDGVSYIDKVDSNRVKPQSGDVTLTGETDRVYLNTAGTVELDDPVLRRRIHIAKENSLATVVWNPGAAKAKAMSDLGDDEWQRFACVETCNVGDYAVTLSPGAQHAMKVIYSLTAI